MRNIIYNHAKAIILLRLRTSVHSTSTSTSTEHFPSLLVYLAILDLFRYYTHLACAYLYPSCCC